MREFFDWEHCQLAEAIAKTQAACRQLASHQMRNDRSRYEVLRELRLRRMFALVPSDLHAINALLSEDAALMAMAKNSLASRSVSVRTCRAYRRLMRRGQHCEPLRMSTTTCRALLR